MSGSFSSERNQWVYLMGQNYQKIKFHKYVLESHKVFQSIIREIEENIDGNCSVVIFLPSVRLEQLEELVKYVANESSMKLQEVNQDLESLLYKINKIAGREDPEEVIQSVDLPSDEWIAIVDDFIESEYPELVVDNQEEALPDRPIRTKYQNNPETLAQVKQRTLEWLHTRINNNKFVGKFCLSSLLETMLPGFESHAEELTATMVKYFMKWKEYEFSGIGNQVSLAKEDAAIYAISRLLDINLKTYTPPSKVKLVCDIMPKIRLDKVMSRCYEEMYQMSVKLPLTGQVVKSQGSSLFNAKEKTFLLASKIVAVEKRQAIERLNKKALIEFYKRETGDVVSTAPETSDEELLGPFDPKEIIRKALSDVNQNEIIVKTEYDPTLETDELEQLKKDGLIRIKPFLKRHLYKSLSPKLILLKFIPNVSVSFKKGFCQIKFKDRQWSFHANATKEVKEIAVTSVLRELFNIELVPNTFETRRGLKEKLQEHISTEKNGNLWTSTVTYEKAIYSVSDKDPNKTHKLLVAKVLSKTNEKHVNETQLLNRIAFAKLFISPDASLVDRIKFVLKYFSFPIYLAEKSRFESTDWLLNSLERALLEEVDNNIQIEQLSKASKGKIYEAKIRLNNEIITSTKHNPDDARSTLILRVFQETEEHMNKKFIVVARPGFMANEETNLDKKVTSLETAKEVPEKSKDEPKPRPKSKRDLIAYYRERALELIYSDRFQLQRKRGAPISPSCILHNVITPEKIKVLQEINFGHDKCEVTVEVAHKAVTGFGYTKKDAKQAACLSVFTKILKIDWDRASKGHKLH